MTGQVKSYTSIREFEKDFPREEGLSLFNFKWCLRHRRHFEIEYHEESYPRWRLTKETQEYMGKHYKEITYDYVAEIEKAHKIAAKSKLVFKTTPSNSFVF